MKRMLTLVTIFVCSVLSGCAGMASPSAYTTQETAPRLTPDEGHGVVCFLRERKFFGSGGSFFIREEGKTVGALRSGSYFCRRVAPGKYTYMAEAIAPTYISVTVEAGGMSSIILDSTFGGLTLTEVTEGTAKQIIARDRLDYITLK